MRKTMKNIAFFYFLAVIFLLNPAKALAQESGNSYPAVLLENVWEIEYEKSDAFPKIIKFFDNGYMTDISAHAGVDGAEPTFNSVGIDIKYSVTNGVLEFSSRTFDFKGKINKDGTIKGKGRHGNDKFTKIRILKKQELIDYYNAKNLFSVSPLSILPRYENRLSGKLNSEIDVVNRLDFYVAVAVVGDNAATYFIAPPDNKVGFRLVPNGHYKIYYLYYNEPDALYQGDDITVNNQEITITLKQVMDGNYSIRKSN